MEETSAKSFMSVKDMTFTAIMTVLIAVCSWISLPIGSVPFTLQTFGIFCAAMLLGGKRGTLAVLVYLLLGALGVPVFAQFTSGIGILAGTTGGYLIGFLIIPALVLLTEKLLGEKLNLPIQIGVLILGLVLCYTFGTAWFIKVYSEKAAVTVGTALKRCVLPFILPDLGKLALATVISGRLKKYVRL